MQALTLSAFLLAVLASASAAQEPGSPLPETSAPQAVDAQPAPIERATPRVGRLSFFSGSVQVQRADNTGEDTPLLNMPLRQGTRIVTSDYGQAEVEFEDGSLVRLTPRSSLSLDTLSLDAKKVAHTRLALLSGLAYFELRKAPALDFQVSAGGVQASPLENLTLRINLDEPPAVFSALAGTAQLQHTAPAENPQPDPPAAEAVVPAFKAAVRAGETLRLDPADDARYFLTSTVAPESWDQWNQDRDQAAANLADSRTAARDSFAGTQGYGWSDLDANGTWYNVPGKGNVWQPADAASPGIQADASASPTETFDPYANGAWVWSGQGYAFASAYPWGWTPYRCGSWGFYPGFGWAWAPDLSCGQFGYAGFESGAGDYVVIYAAAGSPPRHIPIPRPRPGPGNGPAPIVPVRPPTGIHPPRPHPVDSPVRIAGQPATPLPTLGSSLPTREHTIGAALALDYPVDVKSHQPLLGTAPGTLQRARPLPASAAPAPASELRHQRPTETTTQSRPANSTPAYRAAPPPSAPAATHSAPPPPPPPSHAEPPAAARPK